MLNIKKKKSIFFREKIKTVFHKRFFIIFFILILVFTYVIYERFLFSVHIPDESMSPNVSIGDLLWFKKVDDNIKSDLIANLDRGAIIAIKKPGVTESMILKKIFDFPVFFLTLGWVKLNHHKIIARRLLAYPGDKLEIKNKVIYINDKIFMPEWIIKYTDVEIFPSKVTPRDNLEVRYIDNNHIFVINDNWDRLGDSRLFGEVSIEDIVGVLIYNHSSVKNK